MFRRLTLARRTILMITAVLALVVPSLGWAVPASAANPGVLPPQSKPHGKSYGEWSAEWWKWVFSFPAANHPNFQTGTANVDCSANQSGHVWFLAGNFGGQSDRTCTIPPGTMLFFPVITIETDNLFNTPTTFTEAQLRDQARQVISAATSTSATVDGVPITGLAQNYRATSPSFSYRYPAAGLPTIFGCDVLCANAGSTEGTLSAFPGVFPRAVADGVYVMLAPLSRGSHTVHFASAIQPGFSLDVTYHITVTR